MTHLLQPAAPIVGPCASFHADQAARALLKERKQLAQPKLTPHENPTVLVYTVNLEDTLCEVETNCGKFRHGWLLCSGRQHPNYGAMRRREQEASTPSIEQFFSKLKHWLRYAVERTKDDVCNAIGRILETVTATECENYFRNAGHEPE